MNIYAIVYSNYYGHGTDVLFVKAESEEQAQIIFKGIRPEKDDIDMISEVDEECCYTISDIDKMLEG